MIKITSGKYRSRNIETPEAGTLPTKNRVREAMMSAVTSEIPHARVLDLFAGSGALGIESLSRGASFCVFVDASADACRIIRGNLKTLREENAAVLNMSYEAAIEQLKEPFDLVFLDPPYAMKDSYQRSIDLLRAHGLLKDECAIVLEYEGELPLKVEGFSFQRDYTYGKTKVLLLR